MGLTSLFSAPFFVFNTVLDSSIVTGCCVTYDDYIRIKWALIKNDC